MRQWKRICAESLWIQAQTAITITTEKAKSAAATEKVKTMSAAAATATKRARTMNAAAETAADAAEEGDLQWKERTRAKT